MIMVERRPKFELSKDIRYLALTGELLREYCEYFGGKNGACYNGFSLHIHNIMLADEQDFYDKANLKRG